MKKNLEERLRAHPGMYERINRLLEVVENAAGDVNKAAEAERRREVLEQAAAAGSALSRKEKKTLLAQLLRRNLGNRAQTYRRGRGGKQMRPFWSLPKQRQQKLRFAPVIVT